jgi:hypothetical protein
MRSRPRSKVNQPAPAQAGQDADRLSCSGKDRAAAGHVAFDLHRADLLTALRMELPRRQDTERALNEQWCDLWRRESLAGHTRVLHQQR